MLALNLNQTTSKHYWGIENRETKKIKVESITKIENENILKKEHECTIPTPSLSIKQNNQKLIDSPSFYTMNEFYRDIIVTPKEKSKDGVTAMNQDINQLIDNYIEAINKFFFYINTILLLIASLFIIIPLILLFIGKMSIHELLFSTSLGICFAIGISKISKETKEKVVTKCRQKIYK